MLKFGRRWGWMVAVALAAILAAAQETEGVLSRLMTTGEVTLQGQTRRYVVRHLPVSSFPDLPARVVDELNQRGCMVPQTYGAHHPENVIVGSFQHPGSSDWAVLCSSKETVSLLVFFEGNAEPALIKSAPEKRRLQAHDSSGVLGFNWAIEVADPDAIHEKQIGMAPKPARLDHDAVADLVLDRKTVYHYYGKGYWSLVEMPE